MKQPVFIRIYRHNQIELVKQLNENQIVIGRNPDLQVSLQGDSVSPLHAVIEERDNGYYLSDLGSATGTLLNGRKIFDEKIESGDEFYIADYKIEFFIGVPKPKAAPSLKNVEPPPTEASLPILHKSVSPTLVPSINSTSASSVQSSAPSSAPRSAATYEMSAEIKTLNEKLKNSKGSIVEVVVVWRDRVLNSYHYTEEGIIRVGSYAQSEIQLPLLGINRPQHTFLKLGPGVRVYLTAEMIGEFYKDGVGTSLSDLKRMNRVVQTEKGFELDLLQGEMIRVGLHGNLVSLYVRFIPDVPKPTAGPFVGLTSSETAAIIMSVLVVGFFWLYMTLFTPLRLVDSEALAEEPLRKATVVFTPPKVVKATEVAQAEKQVVEVSDKKTAVNQTTKKDPGRASDLRPSDRVAPRGAVGSAINQGASIKTGDKPAANLKTKDVSATGLLGVFGGRGTQKELSKATTGAGELVGDAQSATGAAGGNEERAGDSLGGRLRQVGGGQGTSTVGIAGVGTQGRGTGGSGLGTGGLGQKGNLDINIEGAGASFAGSIDREAIRRVIRENKKLFQYCYDQALRRNPETYGKLEIQWDIEERGRVTNAFVKSNSTGDTAFGRCMADKIKGLVFPEPPSDQIARVVYPFVFTSQ